MPSLKRKIAVAAAIESTSAGRSMLFSTGMSKSSNDSKSGPAPGPSARVDPARGNALLKKLLGSKPLPVVHEPSTSHPGGLLDRLQELIETRITYVSVGTRRDQIIGLDA